MRYRNLIKFLFLHIAAVAFFFASLAYAADLAQQSNQSGGVTIAVKPVEVSPGTATWSFQVSLTTHSQELSDDLAAAAYIVDGAGKKVSPTAWEGDAPGGHHRKGVLRFKALAPPPAILELHIQRQGESAPRKFRWQLK